MILFRLLGQVTTVILTIILTRYLKPELFGRYNYLYVLVVFFAIPLTPAFNDLIVRESIRRPSDRNQIFSVGSGLRLIFALVGFLVALSIIPFVRANGQQLGFLIALFASLGLFFSVWMPSWRYGLESMFQADFRMDSASAINLLGRIAILGLILWGCYSGFGLTGIVGLQAVGELIATLLLIWLCFKMGFPVRPSFNRSELRFQFSETLPLIGAELLILGYTRIDVILLRYFGGDIAVGLFAAPMRLVDAFQLTTTVFIASAMPILARVANQKPEQFRSVVRLTFKIMTFTGLLIAVPLSIYSRDIVSLIYGTDYTGSIAVMTVGAWTIPLIFGLATHRTLLIASHKQNYLPRLFMFLVIINFGVNLILVPTYGAVGAAWAKVITFGALFPLSIFIKDIRQIGIDFIRVSGIPIILAVVLTLVARWINLPFWIGIPIVVAIIAFLSYVSGWFGKRIIDSIKSYF